MEINKKLEACLELQRGQVGINKILKKKRVKCKEQWGNSNLGVQISKNGRTMCNVA